MSDAYKELFAEMSALVLTGRMYLVDTYEGTFDVLSAAEFVARWPQLLNDRRYEPYISMESALECLRKISTRNAGRN